MKRFFLFKHLLHARALFGGLEARLQMVMIENGANGRRDASDKSGSEGSERRKHVSEGMQRPPRTRCSTAARSTKRKQETTRTGQFSLITGSFAALAKSRIKTSRVYARGRMTSRSPCGANRETKRRKSARGEETAGRGNARAPEECNQQRRAHAPPRWCRRRT